MELEQGELILRMAASSNHPVIGVVKEVDKHKIYLFNPSYYLKPARKINKLYYPEISLNFNHSIDLRQYYLKELRRGIDDILDYLKNHPDLRVHSGWVKEMRSPYKLPKPTAFLFIPTKALPTLR